MTEDEILEVLVQADAKLVEYQRLIEPILPELARFKSLRMYEEGTKCKGHLGCYDWGIEIICLHPINFPSEVERSRGYRYMDEWRTKLADRGADTIGIR